MSPIAASTPQKTASERAYTFGLAGVYINQKGREAQGIVARGTEAAALKKELAEKLSGLKDEDLNRVAIRQAWPQMGAAALNAS